MPVRPCVLCLLSLHFKSKSARLFPAQKSRSSKTKPASPGSASRHRPRTCSDAAVRVRAGAAASAGRAFARALAPEKRAVGAAQASGQEPGGDEVVGRAAQLTDCRRARPMSRVDRRMHPRARAIAPRPSRARCSPSAPARPRGSRARGYGSAASGHGEAGRDAYRSSGDRGHVAWMARSRAVRSRAVRGRGGGRPRSGGFRRGHGERVSYRACVSGSSVFTGQPARHHTREARFTHTTASKCQFVGPQGPFSPH